jgi:hypothetical protein
MQANTPTSLYLRDQDGQPGNDRSFDGNNPLYFGSQFGNITGATPGGAA